MVEKLLTRREAAQRLGKSEESLRWMHRQGQGPACAFIGGRAMYRESEVEEFIRQAFGIEDGD